LRKIISSIIQESIVLKKKLTTEIDKIFFTTSIATMAILYCSNQTRYGRTQLHRNFRNCNDGPSQEQIIKSLVFVFTNYYFILYIYSFPAVQYTKVCTNNFVYILLRIPFCVICFIILYDFYFRFW
jgi:hypothetical protein